MEKILNIIETNFDNGKYSGYVIQTEKQEIKFGISDHQTCCENWGYFSSEDDFAEFIGSDLISIETVDIALNIDSFKEQDVEIDDCMFVNFKTTNGLLQFTVYNAHNGYYGHDVILISEQLKIDERL